MANDPLSAVDRGGFLSEAEAIEKEPMPWQARATLYVLVALLLAAATWASFAKVDRIVVGRGKLITTTPTIVVQPLEPSMIRSIDVQVGQIVKKGARLATFDPTFASSDLALAKASSESFRCVTSSEIAIKNRGTRSVPGTTETLLRTQTGCPSLRRYRFSI